MKAMFPTEVQLNKTLIAALTLMLGAIGILLCSRVNEAAYGGGRAARATSWQVLSEET